MTRARTGGVLNEARGVKAMTWIIAIMLFLTTLAAALGVGMWGASRAMERQVAGRATVQIPPDGAGGDLGTSRVLAALRAAPEVVRARPVPASEIAALLEPYLGAQSRDPDLPLPAMIDVDLANGARVDALAARVRAVSPAARIDTHGAWMAPVRALLSAVTWLALAVVALMVAATAAIVVLAARAGLEAHRATIEVMHMLGSTDRQVARLFQRRIARDAMTGGLAGSLAGIVTVILIGIRIAGVGSELLGGAAFGMVGWAVLAVLPFAFTGVAALAAQATVTRALGRAL